MQIGLIKKISLLKQDTSVYNCANLAVYSGSPLSNLMLFNVNVVETEKISVSWNNITHSDKFIYQFAQLVLEFINFFNV